MLRKPKDNSKFISKGLEILKKRNGEQLIKAYVIFREKFIWWSNVKYYVGEYERDLYLVSNNDVLCYLADIKLFNFAYEAIKELDILIKKREDRIKEKFENEVVKINNVILK